MHPPDRSSHDALPSALAGLGGGLSSGSDVLARADSRGLAGSATGRLSVLCRDRAWSDSNDGGGLAVFGAAWEVASVYTRPEVRGRGYAKAVVAFVTAAILGAGKRATCRTASDNRAMQRVAERVGFQQVT
jgi:GNAT superfamily N-acetyltransferase